MKRFLRIFLIFLTFCALVSCKQPVGSIDEGSAGNGGGGAGDLDFLWLVPARFLFETEQWYTPKDDLQIMYAGDGVIKEIPYNAPGVKIELYEHFEGDSPNIILLTNGEIKLNTAGRHQVKVTYNEKSSRYVIEVRGTYSGGGDDSDIFDVVWL